MPNAHSDPQLKGCFGFADPMKNGCCSSAFDECIAVGHSESRPRSTVITCREENVAQEKGSSAAPRYRQWYERFRQPESTFFEWVERQNPTPPSIPCELGLLGFCDIFPDRGWCALCGSPPFCCNKSRFQTVCGSAFPSTIRRHSTGPGSNDCSKLSRRGRSISRRPSTDCSKPSSRSTSTPRSSATFHGSSVVNGFLTLSGNGWRQATRSPHNTINRLRGISFTLLL